MARRIDGERKLTELDFSRLQKMTMAGHLPELAELLAEAEVLPGRDMPPDVVTMYAQVEVQEPKTRARQTLVLCYPFDADPGAGQISVLSPVGLGLLGQQAGAVARWRTPNGDDHAAQVLAVLFQPEAAGDYVT